MNNAEFGSIFGKRHGESGDYFDTHDVVGKTVTRTRKFPLKEYGYERKSGPPSIQVKEVTIPVYDKTGLYVERALQYDLPRKDQIPQKPQYSLIYISGVSSDAVTNAPMMARLEDALEPLHDGLPFGIANIINISHISGSPRTKGPQDAAEQETLAASARILQKALEDTELKVSSDGIALVGYSAGGAQATELAALYSDRCKYLILAEPAGMASHPKIKYDLIITNSWAIFQKYRKAGQRWRKALSSTLWEARVAWGSPKGIPSIMEIIKANLGKKSDWFKQLARAYGFEDEQAKTSGSSLPFKTDSTESARSEVSAHVIFSPVIFAKVVNVIVARLREKYSSVKRIEKAGFEELNADVAQMLKGMFPKARSVHFAGYSGTTHHSPFLKGDFWENIFSSLGMAPSK